MNNQIYLNKGEKKVEILLMLLTITSFIVIVIGIYFQNNNVDRDNILVPILLGVYFVLFGLFSLTGFSKGNLLKKWTPFFLYDFVLFIVKKGKVETDEAQKITNRIVSIITLLLCLLIAIVGFKYSIR